MLLRALHGHGYPASDGTPMMPNDDPWSIGAAGFDDDEIDANCRDREPTTVGQCTGLQ